MNENLGDEEISPVDHNIPEIQRIGQEIVRKKLTPKLYPAVKLMMQKRADDEEALEDDEGRKNARNNPQSSEWKRLEKNVTPQFVITKKENIKSYRSNFIPVLEETQEFRDKYADCSNLDEAIFESQVEATKGGCYQGQWYRGKRQGLGTQYWTNEIVYHGYWEKDHPSTPGQIIKWLQGERYLTFYSGDLKDFLRDGYGEYGHRDLWYGYMYTYKGQWLNDLKHGEGKESFNGETYDGMFLNDKREGSGKCTFNTGYLYEGNWSNNKMHGKGIFTYGNKIYEGEMALGYMEGKGKLTDKDKNREYEGEFKHDAFHGKGKMTWNDGRYYDGEWDFGVQNGNGEFKFADGKIRKGVWKEGRVEKWLD